MNPITLIQFPMFNHNVIVAVGKKGYKLYNECCEHESLHISKAALEEAGAAGMTSYVNPGLICIYLNYKDMGHLAHEAVHAVNMIFSVIGHEPTAENDEVQAYMVGHIVSEVCNADAHTPVPERSEKE